MVVCISPFRFNGRALAHILGGVVSSVSTEGVHAGKGWPAFFHTYNRAGFDVPIFCCR